MQVLYSSTALVESGYHPDNCYHNCTHAADVAQALHCLLMEPKVRNSRVLVQELSYYSNSSCVTSVTVDCLKCFLYRVTCTMYNVCPSLIMAMCCTCISTCTCTYTLYTCTFSVCLFMVQLYRHTTPLELLALFIAALCHDLDHPGQLPTDYYALSLVTVVWLITMY